MLSVLGERPGRRGQALALGERVLERGEPLAGEPRLLEQRLALGLVRDRGEQRLRAQPFGELERASRRSSSRSARAPQPVERGGRALAAPGRVRELLLDAVALGQQRLEPLVDALALERRRGPPLLDLAEPLVDLRQVELGHAAPAGRRSRRAASRRAPRRSPVAPAGAAGLHLGLEIACALDLHLHARELQLRPVAAALELAEAGGLLDQRPPLLGLARKDLLDLALADDRAVAAAEPDVGEQLDEVGAAHGRAVDQVLALAAAVQPPRDRDLGEVELGAAPPSSLSKRSSTSQ